MIDQTQHSAATPARADAGVMNSHRARRAKLAIAMAAIVAVPAISQALPVIPNGMGYGIDTPAGRGGAVYRVTNLNESGSGSLKACVDASGPRVCIFEVSGTIKLTGDLIVRNSKITIAGQTAPSPGIMLRGGGLMIKASDVLVQHIRVRPGDDPTGTAPENRDALKIETSESAPIKNVVIDHCSFSWAIDEMASAWKHWDNVTIINSIFAEPLHDSLHPKGTHGYGVLFGPSDGKASFIGNLLAHQAARNPLSTARQVAIVNNVVYNWGGSAVDLQSQSGTATQNSVIGNVFIRGKSYEAHKPILIRADTGRLVPEGSKIYLADNEADEKTSDPWSLVQVLGGSLSLTSYKSSSPLGWPTALTTLPTSGSVVLNRVLSNAGARPADRDSVDRRIVQQVKDRTGEVINCVSANGTERCKKNAGGWPSLANNRRTLALPADPNKVSASGYTNLELWLHSMAAQVEGRGSSPKPPVLQVTE